jgi:hypothetical protein
MKNTIITDEEEKAIRALKRIAKKWPESLWLFSASGDLFVMRYGSDGDPVMTPGGGVDHNYIVGKLPRPQGAWL